MTADSHKPFILFITGTSAAGKTTLYQSLQHDKSLSDLDIDFHDIDEAGVPPVGRSAWRKFRVEELLYNAVLGLQKGHSTIICGISKPHEIVESRYFKPGYNIHFLLVEVPFKLVEQRLTERTEAQTKTGAFDEVFNPDALQETLLANKNLLRELKNSITQQRNGHSLDASKLTKNQMHDKTLEVIAQLRTNNPKLT